MTANDFEEWWQGHAWAPGFASPYLAARQAWVTAKDRRCNTCDHAEIRHIGQPFAQCSACIEQCANHLFELPR